MHRNPVNALVRIIRRQTAAIIVALMVALLLPATVLWATTPQATTQATSAATSTQAASTGDAATLTTLANELTPQGSTSYSIYPTYYSASYTKDGTTYTSSVTIDGSAATEGMTVKPNASVALIVAYAYSGTTNIAVGDSFSYDLPTGIAWDEMSTTTKDGLDITVTKDATTGKYILKGTYNSTFSPPAINATTGKYEVGGFLTATGKLASTSSTDGKGGDFSYAFPGIGSYDVHVPVVTVEKGYATAVAGQDYQKQFVLAVSSASANTNVAVSDVLTSPLALVAGSVAIYTDPACTIPYTGTVTTRTSDTATTFTRTISSMSDGETLYVKYLVNTKAAYTATNETTRAYANTAHVTSREDTTDNTSTKNVTISKTWVAKSGTYSDDGTTKSITWTILVNQGDAVDITGTTVKDALQGTGYDTRNVTVTVEKSSDKGSTWTNATASDYSLGTSITVWDALVAGTLKLNGSAEYRLTFTTPVTDVPAASQIAHTNNAVVAPYGGTTTYTGTATVKAGTAATIVQKYVSDPTLGYTGGKVFTGFGRTPTWTIKVNPLQSTALTNAYVDDTIPANYTFNASSLVVYTGTDASHTTVYDTKNYSVTTYTGTDNLVHVKVTFGTIPSRNTSDVNYYVTYTTTLNPNLTGTLTDKNQVDFLSTETAGATEGVHSEATYKHVESLTKTATSTASKNVNSDGTVTWKVVVTNTLASDYTAGATVAVVDTLPTNMTYLAGSLASADTRIATANLGNYMSMDASVSGKLTFTLTSAGSAWLKMGRDFSFTYKTQPTDLTGVTSSTAFANSAQESITENGVTTSFNSVTATGNVNVSGTLTKTQALDTYPYVTYTVKANPSAIDLNANGDTVTFTDVLGSELDYVHGSLTINGTALASLDSTKYSASYNGTSRTLTITAPDDTALTITYKAQSNLADSATFSEAASNTVSMTGNVKVGTDQSTSLKDQKFTISGGSSSYSYHNVRVYKYSASNENTVLEGATFSVEKVPVTTTGTVMTTTGTATSVATLASGADGYTNYFSQAENTTGDFSYVYRLTETSAGAANTGYLVDSTPRYFVLNDTNANLSDYTVTDGGTSYALTSIAQTNYAFDIPNVPTTSVTAKKVWVDSSDVAKLRPGSVTFKLRQTIDGTTTDVAGKDQTLGAANADATDATGSTWTTSWTGLPAYTSAGKAITYSVIETSTDANYTASTSTDGLTVTNTLKTHKVTFAKVDAATGTAITGAAFQVKRGDTVVATINDTTKTANLPAGDYTLTETTAPTGYDTVGDIAFSVGDDGTVRSTATNTVNGATVNVVSGNATSGFVVTAADTAKTTSYTVTKTWADASDQDGKRPTSISVRLVATVDGSEVTSLSKSTTLASATSWAPVSWSDLPVEYNGKQVTYTVTEVPVLLYTTSSSATTTAEGTTVALTNTHTPESVSVKVTKFWSDGDDLFGLRPQTVTVSLFAQYADGTELTRIQTLTLGLEGVWTRQIDDLPKYAGGKEIVYSFQEESDNVPAGYAPSYAVTPATATDLVDATTVTNSLAKYAVSFAKKDAGTGNVVSGAAFEVHKAVNGKDVVVATIASSTDSVSLPEGDYTLVETAAPTGYVLDATPVPFTVALDSNGDVQVTSTTAGAVTYDATAGWVVSMSDASETTTVSVKKVWDDGVDQSQRPASVVIDLYANGTKVSGKELTLDAGNSWAASWTDLPTHVSGAAVTYTVVEETVGNGYTATVSGDATNGYTVTNKRTPGTTSLTATKVWDDENDVYALRPTSVELTLWQQVGTGEKTKVAGGTATVRASTVATEDWAHTWTDLPEYSGTTKIAYSVTEETVPSDYSVAYATDAKTGVVTVTNTLTTHPVSLAKHDAGTGNPLAGSTFAIVDSNGVAQDTWVSTTNPHTINLPAGDYTLVEKAAPAGYELAPDVAFTVSEAGEVTGTNVTGSATAGYTVTMSDPSTTTSVSVKKVWSDDDNADGTRPSTVTVRLLANGADTTKTVTLSAENGWTYTWTGLASRADGADITYTVGEVVPNGYKSVVTGTAAVGFTITNSHTPTVTPVSPVTPATATSTTSATATSSGLPQTNDPYAVITPLIGAAGCFVLGLSLWTRRREGETR